ncbi:MAG: hypothetical protein ACXQTL_06020 [Methanosarcinales archaeon]
MLRICEILHLPPSEIFDHVTEEEFEWMVQAVMARMEQKGEIKIIR